MKASLVVVATSIFLCFNVPAVAQTISYNPGLPSSEIRQADSSLSEEFQDMLAEAKQPPLSAYQGTYVGVVVYYDISNGVGDWEVVFDANGNIRLSNKFQTKYPNARVTGKFTADGKFTYTNSQTNGLTFTTTGRVDRVLKRLTATFTSNSAGTGALVCHQL